MDITLASQWAVPIPPSPGGSKAIIDRFKERGISYRTETVINALDPENKRALTTNGEEIPYDLFLGVPVHRVPGVVEAAGLSENGWISVDDRRLLTKYPGVYAVGDVTSAPVPKAGVFAESAADAVASDIITNLTRSGDAEPFSGRGSCYVEVGDNLVGRMDADFFPGTRPSAPFAGPSVEVANEKREFVEVRRRRWFGV